MCDNDVCSVEEDVAKTKEFQKTEEGLQHKRKDEVKRRAQLDILMQQLLHQQMSKKKRRLEKEAFLKKLEKELEQQMREITEVKKRERTNIREKMKKMFLEQLKIEGQLQCKDTCCSKHSSGLHHAGHLSVSSSFEHSIRKNRTDSDNSKSYRFLLVGKSGREKVSTGSTILGHHAFNNEANFHSVTSSSTLKSGMNNDTPIEVMDCPGLFDTGKTHEEVATEVIQAVACMHPGFTAILYVIMINRRYTEEEAEVFNRLKSLFDHHVTEYIIIIFSRGDELTRRKEQIDDVLMKAPDLLHKVLDECGHRYVVFDNMADDKQPQVDQLMQEVCKLREAHGGKPYTCPKYREVGEKMEKEVARRLKKAEEEKIRTKKYIEKLKETMKQMQDQAAVDKLKLKNMEVARNEEKMRMIDEMDQHLTSLVEAFHRQQYFVEQRHQKELRLLQAREKQLRKQITALVKQRTLEIEPIEKVQELVEVLFLLFILLVFEIERHYRQIVGRRSTGTSCVIM
ncbi:hypothetical protein C0Q70_06452 [Pomacea canaliculata]|uniref:AIG1-type G domain-containing protein n=1 Tax=Pomacea canaliculata TaxID=400727 RepID=A0A2T7PP27_POMCA|nr:immune-associated nucleotide-binding protein 3-like [Pomacea canaliculata]PVD35171.1 hypothetical protein C0Q70_06452 [Pomacea canaliculata]